MNTRIHVQLCEDPPGLNPPCMRLKCLCWLSTWPGDPSGRLATIDSGSPFSIIPPRLWQSGRSQIDFAGGEVTRNCRTICGLSGGSLPCEFGWLHVMLADRYLAFSDWLRIPAKLATGDDVPLVLGMAGFLDTYEVALNKNGESYVVVPGF